MSIFDKIKSVFIVEEDEGKPSSSTVKDVDSPKSKSSIKVSVSKEDSDKFENILFKAIEESNLTGFDYLEYIQSINNLKKQNFTTDEKKLFMSAFALAKTMNVDKKSLLVSADHYLNVLAKENSRFNEALVNSAKVKIKEKKDALVSIHKLLEKDKKSFEQLKLRIEKSEAKAKLLEKELEKSGNKVETIKAGFKKALVGLTNKIEKDKSKIEKYL